MFLLLYYSLIYTPRQCRIHIQGRRDSPSQHHWVRGSKGAPGIHCVPSTRVEVVPLVLWVLICLIILHNQSFPCAQLGAKCSRREEEMEGSGWREGGRGGEEEKKEEEETEEEEAGVGACLKDISSPDNWVGINSCLVLVWPYDEIWKVGRTSWKRKTDNLVFGGDLPQRTSEFPVNQQEWAGWDGQTGRLQ